MSIRRPILLFGMPRSGTTWLGKIFDSHPATLYRHEPDSFSPIHDVPLIADPAHAARYTTRLHQYLAETVDMRAEQVCGKQPIFPKAYSSAMSVGLHQASTLLSKVAGRIGWRVPVSTAGMPRHDADWQLVWKSIESLGRLGVLLRAYSDAQAVQILRHPCGYVASVLRGEAKQQFSNLGTAEDWGIFTMLCDTPQARRHGLTVERLRSIGPIERLAWRWVLLNEKAREDSVDTGRSTLLHYEELCADPKPVARRLFTATGLSWHAQTERFLEQSTSRSRSDYYSVFKDPLESAWKWRQELDSSETRRVLSIAAESALAEGYRYESYWNRTLPPRQ